MEIGSARADLESTKLSVLQLPNLLLTRIQLETFRWKEEQ